MALSGLDIFFIILYFLILIFIGYISSRKQSEEDFLIGERNLGALRTMFTVNASKMGSILMAFVALVFLWGFAAVWYFIGAFIGMLLFLIFAIRVRNLSQNKYYTLADYFRYNYGKKTAKLASIGGIILMFGFLVINLIAGTKIFVFFTNWPFWAGSIIMALIVLTYLLLAGYRAVVKTDVLQYIAMFTIMVLMAILLFDGSLIPSSEWNILNINPFEAFGFLFGGILSSFGIPDLWQRVYSAKSNKELKKGWLLSVFIYAIMVVLLSLVALTVKVKFPSIVPDFALIHAFDNLLPAGLVGLAVVLLFAAIMSSADTYIFAGASSIVQDFSNKNKKETIKLIRKTIFLFVTLATLVSILIQDLIIGSYIFVAFAIVIAIQAIATWFNKNVKPISLNLGFSLGYLGLGIGIINGFFNGFSPSMIAYVLIGSILGLIIGQIFKR